MAKNYAVIYDKGGHDGIEEEGCYEKCKIFVDYMQPAYDKILKIVPEKKVRRLRYLTEDDVCFGYEIY